MSLASVLEFILLFLPQLSPNLAATMLIQIELALMEPLEIKLAILLSLADSFETLPLLPSCLFLLPISASFRILFKALVCFSQLPASIFHLTRYPILLLSAQIMLYPTPFP